MHSNTFNKHFLTTIWSDSKLFKMMFRKEFKSELENISMPFYLG